MSPSSSQLIPLLGIDCLRIREIGPLCPRGLETYQTRLNSRFWAISYDNKKTLSKILKIDSEYIFITVAQFENKL